MELAAAGLNQQPFRTHGRPPHFVAFQGQADASAFLYSTFEHPHGLGILQGPSQSGKTTLLWHFLDSLDDEHAIALVDGRDLPPKALLERILGQFGFNVKLNSVNELMNMLRVFALQQAASHHAPLLIVENTQSLDRDSLPLLCKLADLRAGDQSALRLILAGDRSITSIVDAPAMESVGQRVTGVFNVYPMEDYETLTYLHAKLRAAGCDKPALMLPDKTCTALHEASGGWPGIVDRLMLLALARAESAPIDSTHVERPKTPAMTGRAGLQTVGGVPSSDARPRLFLTYIGKTLKEIPFDRSRIMIGRSEHNDLPIISRFVSRHHAMFIRDGDTTILMDLNSRNGTFVNSKRISNHVMVHDDIVSIGHHGLKFVHTSARERKPLSGESFSDTVIMRSLDDLRRLLARGNTQSVELPDPGKTSAGDSG